MKILLATDSQKTNDYLAVQFVEEGIEPYKTIEKENIPQLIKTKQCDALVIDIDSPNYDDLETVKAAKNQFDDISIILMTARSGVDFVKEVVSTGVYGIISKLDDFASQFIKIIALFDSLKIRKEEKRRHIRVKPASFQHNTFTLKIPGLEQEYQGEVKDISIGGVALTFSTPPPDSLLFKGKEIYIKLELGVMSINSKGVVVLKKGMDSAILFRQLSKNAKKIVSEYILSRIDT